MQGSSFWKTVAIVGVIGIGSLAILEVQNRLPKQNIADEPTAEDLAALVAGQGTGDSTVTPDLSDSDFDKMMAAAQSGDTPLFNGSEPPVDATPSEKMDAGFFDSEPVAAQNNTPPIDTNVRPTSLAQGPNPFEEKENVTAVAANYQGEPSTTVEPVAFIGQDTFASDTVQDKGPQPFRREGVPAPETEAAAPDEFSLFPPDSSLGEPVAARPLADDRKPVAVPDRTDAIEFFNGNEPALEESAAQTASQFYDNDLEPLRSTPEVDVPNPFPESPPVSRSPSLAPAMDIRPNGSLPFPNRPEPQPELTNPSDLISNPFSGDMLPPQDEVPAPRDVQPGMIPEPNFPNFDNRPFPETDTNQPTPDNSLPPVSNFDGASQARPFSVPELQEPGRMTIPDSQSPRFDDRRLPEDSRSFENMTPRRDTTPTYPDFNDRSRDNNDSRNFDGSSRFNEESRSLDIEPRRNTLPREPDFSQPFDDEPRDFNNTPRRQDSQPLDERSREIDNTPQRENIRPLDDRSRDFDIMPRREDIRPLDDRSREFENTPRRENIRPFTEQPREFNSSRDTNDRSDFPSTPEITPRRGGYDSKPPMRDTRPADYDLSDRRDQGGIRQVSGIMRPNLMLEKTAPENATVGVPLDYKIYVRNEGDAPAYDVVVEDEITAGAQIDGARPQPDLDRATNRLIWKFAEIPPNQSEEITVRLTPTGEGTLDGVATVRFKSRVKATTVITAPKLSIEMTGPEEVKLGEEVAYRYVITNDGSGEARDVFVRTVLPTDGGLKHPQGRDLEYEIGTMSPGQQREIVLAVVAGEPGEYMAEAIVSGTGGAKDQAAWRTNIIGAQLQIVRRGPQRRFVGKSATYENIVSNETNFDAVDARIVEAIPEGMRFKGANKGGTFDQQTQTVTWRINRLGPGRQEQLQIELMPTDAGQRESVVTVYENAGLQSENYVTTTVVEDLHNVGAQMSQLEGPMAVNETFGFTITIDNRGTADATDVELVIDVPQQIEVLGAGSRTDRAKLTGNNQVQYSKIVRIEPDKRQTFELKLRGTSPVRNKMVTARVKYRQMDDPLIVSEAVTIYNEL